MSLFPTITSAHWRDQLRRARATRNNVAERIRQKLMSSPIIETKATESGPSVPGPDTLAELYRVWRELGVNRVNVAVDSTITDGDGNPEVWFGITTKCGRYICNRVLAKAEAEARDYLADYAARKAEKIANLKAQLAKLEAQ